MSSPRSKIDELLNEAFDLAREHEVPILVANVVDDSNNLAMRSWLPFGAPGRMASARDMLTMGYAVFNDVLMKGDKLGNITTEA